MTIVDDKVLKAFRKIYCACEVCGARGPIDPHHVIHRGHGGGSRIDHVYALLALCRLCHIKIEAGQLEWRGLRITLQNCFELIAEREGLGARDVRDAVLYFRRLNPKFNQSEIEDRMRRLRPGTAKLVRVLLEARQRSLEAA